VCGIIGYVGKKDVVPLLLEGLKRLEYRGYDSAGIAVQTNGRISVEKVSGRISALEARLGQTKLRGISGIGHTRWATHGAPTKQNAHPHVDCGNRVALVHNGIIENCNVLREMLIKEGHVFKSETDTEVLAHLIERFHERG
jgi:glucosamine--fructose-6-phosphate aminotransferase (isomerizing)